MSAPALADQPIADGRTFKVSELNGDGLLDVVAANPDSGIISIHLGIDEDSFSDPVTIEIANAGVLVVADLDGDGFPDIAVASSNDSYIDIHRNHGDGSFAHVNRVQTIGVPQLLRPVVRQPGGPVSLVACSGPLNTAILIESCIKDSSIVEIQPSFSWDDHSRTLTSMGAVTDPYTNGDMDGDGLVDLSDVNIVISDLDDEVPSPEAGRWCNDNNFIEPNCGGFDRRWEGVQECMRAALCREVVCEWAACIGLRSGGTLAWWFGQGSACAAVGVLELTACLSAAIPVL